MARRGRVLTGVVERAMRERYFSALPPKSCGREEFGAGFTDRLIGMCRDAGGTDADCVATATALTAESVVGAYRGFVVSHLGVTGSRTAMVREDGDLRGGGWGEESDAMGCCARGLQDVYGLGVKVRAMEELGVPAQAKEGMAFALLAWLTWNGRAGNIPAATGARGRWFWGR